MTIPADVFIILALIGLVAFLGRWAWWTGRQADPKLACSECGSEDIQCLEWIEANSNVVLWSNTSNGAPSSHWWCPACEEHGYPVEVEAA